MNAETLIQYLTQALTEKYKSDPSAPSLLISWLNNRYYVSLVHYTHSFGQGKNVLISYEGYNLKELLIKLGKALVETKVTALDKLKQVIYDEPPF